MNTNNPHSKAEGQIRLAIQRLVKRYPFHAGVLERFALQSRPDISTMGVTLLGKRIALVYNPEFVLAIQLDELMGVLLHEVYHVVFGHLTTPREAYPDRWARTVAEEVTVNEFVTEPLPGEPITLELFPDFPSMESTAERYQRLVLVTDRFPIEENQHSQPAGDEGDEGDGDVEHLVDDHSGWEAATDDPDAAEAAVKAVLQEAVLKVGVQDLDDEMKAALGQQGMGSLLKDILLEGLDKPAPRLEWARLLQRYVGGVPRREADFRRPPRRAPELVGVMPGRSRRSGYPNITAVIDTSGSMTPDLLAMVSSELGRMARQNKVTVVECDAEIKRTYRFRPITEVKGGGGTDLRPPFETALLRKLKPDLIIYFTDGCGPAPERAPKVPVIWCLTPGGVAPVEWGRVIEMEESTVALA